MTRFENVENVPRLHVTPLASIRIEDGRIAVEADDEHEKRVRLVCEPYQAVRVVTADCFDMPPELTVTPGTIIEVRDSEWVVELSEALKRNDHTATFMKKAWGIRCEPAT
jgi:hypothetical protein